MFISPPPLCQPQHIPWSREKHSADRLLPA
jgi:hypothetical protein